MGQYYKAVCMDSDGNMFTFDPRCTNDGPKLMEHAYMKNEFVNGVLEFITLDGDVDSIRLKAKRVAWVGDYADKRESTPDDLWCAAYGDDVPYSRFERKPEQHIDGYIVNLSKREYINLGDYAAKSTVNHGYQRCVCIHPLPLLTALGNGLGGGDYYGTCMEYVGSWAGDIMFYTTQLDSKTECFKELHVKFMEGEE